VDTVATNHKVTNTLIFRRKKPDVLNDT